MKEQIIEKVFAAYAEIDYTGLMKHFGGPVMWDLIEDYEDGDIDSFSRNGFDYDITCITNMYHWTPEEIGDCNKSAHFTLTGFNGIVTVTFNLYITEYSDGATELELDLKDVEFERVTLS